ncbi:MAG: amidohydrolase [Selenomonadaceae bacterium]|nr:amidohydrolase [Selenomonadaceae bacterium]
MKRRDFLKLGGMGAFSLLAMGVLAAGEIPGAMAADRRIAKQAVRLPLGRKVDFHSHAILPSYIKGMEELGIDPVAEEGYPLPKWSVEGHLAFMANMGIDYSVLSLPTPHIYRGDTGLSRKVARSINEEMAALCRRYPQQFGFVATLPFPDAEGSLAEIRYSLEELGALGVKVPSNADGVYLGDPKLEEVFAELNRRKALVILHPSPARELPREQVVTGKVMALFEYPADTTRAVLNLLASGTLASNPEIRLVVPHCGSFLPYMKSRAKAMFAMLVNLGMMEPVDVDSCLARLYFDLAGDPMPEAMDMLLAITDTEHIIYGSDYPYVAAPILQKKKAALDIALAERGQLAQVYVQNAESLL